MKQSVNKRRALAVAMLLTGCTIFHQQLEARLYVKQVEKTLQKKISKKKFLAEEHFLLKVLLRFVAMEEEGRCFLYR